MNIVVVLIEPRNPGNIGAVARAMMNMGFEDLRLVNPEGDHLCKEAMDRSVDAHGILAQAKVFQSLKEAVADCHQTIGTCGQERNMPQPVLTPREWVVTTTNKLNSAKTALVFGREDHGMSSDEIMLCDLMLRIPSSNQYPSLNLSHAVMIVLYEIFLDSRSFSVSGGSGRAPNRADFMEHGWAEPEAGPERKNALSTNQEKEGFFDHLQEILLKLDYLDSNNPDHIMKEIRNFFSRTELTSREIILFRGILRKLGYLKK